MESTEDLESKLDLERDKVFEENDPPADDPEALDAFEVDVLEDKLGDISYN